MTDARPTKADLLFGQLGLKTGVLEKRHLQEGLAKQEIPGETRPLGKILIDLGHITSEGVDQIIAAQTELLAKKRSRSKAEKEDNLFGKVAIRLRFCTGEQVSEALDTQENLPANRFMRLGDIMVIKGFPETCVFRTVFPTDTSGRKVFLWKASTPEKPHHEIDIWTHARKPILDLWLHKETAGAH